MDVNDIKDFREKIAAKVHGAWVLAMTKRGYHAPMGCPRKPEKSKMRWRVYCRNCNSNMYPFDEVPEIGRKAPRQTVDMVLGAIRSVAKEEEKEALE